MDLIDAEPLDGLDPAAKAFGWRHAVSFCGGVLAMLVSGTLYAYGAFAKAIESQLGISAIDSGYVQKFGNIGLCMAVTVGATVDRFGLRASAFVGAVLGGGGFLLMWAHVEGYIGGKGVVAMSTFYFIAGQGCQFTYMPGLMNYKNISPKYHGVSLGILDMSFGLSSVIFSQIYAQSFGLDPDPLKENLSGFLLFLAGSMIVVNMINLIILYVPSHRREVPRVQEAFAADVGTPTLPTSPSAVLRSCEFWLLFVFFMLNQGATIWFIGAVSDMSTAFGLGHSGATLTTIITATGAVCRISAGVLSDLLNRFVSRIAFLLGLSLLLPVGFALLVAQGGAALTMGSVLIGAGFGSAWCLVPLMVSDTFGLQNFSTIWGIVIMGSAIGPFILQPIDSAVQAAHSTSKHCLGEPCYQNTYLVCLAMSVLASGLLLLLACRLRDLIKRRELVQANYRGRARDF